jgi:hypothetical protein
MTVQAEAVLALITHHVFSPWLSETLVRQGAAAAARWLEDHPQ